MSELVARGVTFDFGQVLASLDPVYLAEKLASLGVIAEPVALAAAMPAGWEAYGKALRTGGHGGSAWKLLIRTVVEHAGAAVSPDALQFLFDDQRPRNLWRRPVPGMIDLARDLRALGVPVGIVSNSEGALATLVETLGWTSDFPVVADSGVLGFEKPGRTIFDWTATRLAVPVETLVHIGDSWAADVEGALGVGAHAIWFVEGQDEPIVPASVDERRRGRVSVARDAAGVRRALALALGRPVPSSLASS